MKFYPKTYSDFCNLNSWKRQVTTIGCNHCSVDDFISLSRNFYKKVNLEIFEHILKQIWLEQQFIVKGKRRVQRVGNGIYHDMVYGKFNKIVVGTTHRVLTTDFIFMPVSTYLIDFFPDFLINNPFENMDYYAFPYKNLTLDHLAFVYQMDNRLELLEEAEKRSMSYAEFINWVINWTLCYNDDTGSNNYYLCKGLHAWPFIRNRKLKKFWQSKKFNFNVKK